MKILHFVTGGFSGATQVAVDLCEASSGDAAFNVKLVLRRKRNTSPERLALLRSKGIDVEVVPGWSHLATIFFLRRICKEWQPDVLVAHGFSEHIWGRIAGLWSGVPHMVHVEHNSRERYTLWRLFLSRWLGRHTTCIVGVSEGVKTRLLELGFPSEKCISIPNGVRWSNFQSLRLSSWDSRQKAVLMVARFARQKDPLTLISAIARLSQQGHLVPLSFAGAGKKSVLARCQTASIQHGLAGQIKFLGQVQQLPQLLAQHQIFVLSTHYEGMPLALIEAMACGCACIGTDVIGVREVIEHGKTGLLVPEGDAKALADAILLFLSQPKLAQKMGQAARQSVQDRFTADRMHARYMSLFNSMG